MRLPKLKPDTDYQGLYVVDFGDAGSGQATVGVGYTAEEVAVLLESERYRDAHVYKVHRVLPDGTVELRGMSPRRFQVESAFVFSSRDKDAARKDFDDLVVLAERDPPPCRARLLYGGLGYQPRFPWVAALFYPAEYEDELSAWLLRHDVRAGESVEGGISHATTVLENLQVRDSAQLVAAAGRRSRSRDEVLRAVGQALQR